MLLGNERRDLTNINLLTLSFSQIMQQNFFWKKPSIFCVFSNISLANVSLDGLPTLTIYLIPLSGLVRTSCELPETFAAEREETDIPLSKWPSSPRIPIFDLSRSHWKRPAISLFYNVWILGELDSFHPPPSIRNRIKNPPKSLFFSDKHLVFPWNSVQKNRSFGRTSFSPSPTT